MFQISYTESALKSIENFPAIWQKKILKAIESLKTSPFQGKKLKGCFSGMYCLRIWPYRIIYLVKKEEKLVAIITMGHRQSVYK